MSRILANIILVLIIAFTVSAVPINTELLNLNITIPDVSVSEETEPVEEVPVEEDTLKFTYQDNTFDYLYNPESIEMKFVANASINDEQADLFLNTLIVEVFGVTPDDKEDIIKRVDGADLEELLSHSINGDVLTVTLHISNNDLKLANGHYESKIKTSSDAIESPFEVQLQTSYFNEVTYKSPVDKASRGNRIITLYFTDPGKNFLVPVSREIKDNGRLIRTTLNALRDGPAKDSGLNQTSPAPYVPAARFSTVTEMVSLETNSYENQAFTQTDEDTYLMIHSLINTMTHIENVASVKFSVDKKDNQALNGIDLSKPYPRPDGTKAHLSLQLDNNRVYLIPMDSNATDATSLLKDLKYGVDGSEKLFNPVLPSIEVIQESLEDGVLNVRLSKDIHEAYSTNSLYAQAMLDSIVQSFATLPGVEKLQLTTETQSEGSLYDYTLGEAFEPARYLNME